MNYLFFYGIGFLSFMVGTIGFAQIIGSLRLKQPYFLIPTVLWIALLFVFYSLISFLAPTRINALYIGYVISFIIITSQNKIE